MTFLVTRTTHFFNAKGSSDIGGVLKFLSPATHFKYLKPDVFYSEDVNWFIDSHVHESEEECRGFLKEECEARESYAQDGYNCKRYTFTVKEIPSEEVQNIEKTLKEYDKI